MLATSVSLFCASLILGGLLAWLCRTVRFLVWLCCTVRFFVVFCLGCVVLSVSWRAFGSFLQRVLVDVQIVAYVDVDAGHTWAGHFLTEGSMACIATCNAVFGHALSAPDLEAVPALSGTFDAAERFVVLWLCG
jgi:hypothetical protein